MTGGRAPSRLHLIKRERPAAGEKKKAYDGGGRLAFAAIVFGNKLKRTEVKSGVGWLANFREERHETDIRTIFGDGFSNPGGRGACSGARDTGGGSGAVIFVSLRICCASIGTDRTDSL